VWFVISINSNTSAVYIIALACAVFSSPTSAATAQNIQYNRDVRPILADKCFRCHGRDEAARQADLRLDNQKNATADRGGYRVITQRKPAASELIRRITSVDEDKRMPPTKSGATLNAQEIEVIRQWIKQGAVYQKHWSFIAPRRPSLPEVRNRDWARNAIDMFVLARLEQDDLQPSAEADKMTLLRRVTLDLTGLPPTLEEFNEFECDSTRDPQFAFYNLIDQLLASPRYGELMTISWLDLARYADTNGYFTDNDRTMWRWRDWVIDAFNQGMTFDQFTIEQLAGDLLPGATTDQRIATGFNRNHMVNNETGIIEEEFRVEYVVDRVNTTATVWMGLTLGCARCHDHKYDPISQKEFYRFFSFFNNVPERGLSGSRGNATPFLKVPTPEQQAQLDQLRRALNDAEKKFALVGKQLDATQSEWEETAIERLPKAPRNGLVAHYELEHASTDGSNVGSVGFVAGMVGDAAKFDGDAYISIPDSVEFDRNDAFSYGAWIHPASAGCVISKIDDANDLRGFDTTLRKGKVVVNLVHRWNSDAIQVSTTNSIPTSQWQHLMVTYDGSSKAAGVKVYLDGKLQPANIGQDSLTGTIRNSQPLRIGRRQASASLKGMIDDVRFYDRQLTDDEAYRLATRQLVYGIITKPLEKRSVVQKRKLRAYFVQHHADERLAAASERLEELRAKTSQYLNYQPTTMVMQESDKPREAFVLVRGQYDQRGEQVTAGVPAFLESTHLTPRGEDMSGSAGRPTSPNRLALAKWLVEPSHPLTARVTVNRLWQQLFDVGIVKTADDFGTQGDWPSHLDLLDWLATEFVESGWDMKHLLRLIVTSSTYRQSSNVSAHLLRRDRENRLLARGPRFRMDAEMLRDNALSVSGLLVEKLGGPSVKPYQPAGLWRDVTYDGELAYKQDHGESLYRRSLYTFWKRQSPPPSMLTFDAPTRETCMVQRSRTNTPLQALVLMNDPTFVEAARKLAARTMTEVNDDPSDRIVIAFRLATARRPSVYEVNVLLGVFRHQLNVYQQDRSQALKLLSVGESKRNQSLEVSEFAAWTVIANMILSLDETITRQ